MNRKSFITLLGLLPLSLLGATPSKNDAPSIKSSHKFLRGHQVKIISFPSYIEKKQEAIVIGSYRELYHSNGGSLSNEYELLWLHPDGTPWQTVAWYREEDLVMTNSNRDNGEQLYQSYLDKQLST